MFYLTGGIVNVTLNTILFMSGIYEPVFYIATTMIGEIVCVLMEYRFIRNESLMDVSDILKNAVRYVLLTSGFIPVALVVMYVRPVELVVSLPLLLNTAIIIVVCVMYYVFVLYATKDTVFVSVLEGVKQKSKQR